MASRTENATRNIIWGIIEKVMTLLLPFITRTVLIKMIGAQYLGLNTLFTSILHVLSISELGIGTAIVFSMYKPIAEKDNEKLCALINVYRKIYFAVGTVILVAGLAITPFIKKLIKSSYPDDINIYILFLIYLFNTVIGYYLYAYQSAIFTAYQRSDLISKRTALVSCISNVLQICVLFLFRNYYMYVIIIPLATIITNFMNAYLARKMFPNIVCKGKITKEEKTGLKKRITGLLSYKIYGVIFDSVDVVVISAFIGLTELAIYNNYFYVQKSILGFMMIITSSITAGIGSKMITNSVEDNYKDFKNLVFAQGWICSWASVCMFCLYQHFMTWWVGEELTFPFSTMCLMTLYFFIPRLTNMSYTYREAAGLWWEDRFRPLISTVVNLGINLILVQIIGINGVVISTLVCSVFINIPWGTHILFKNYFKRSSAEYFRHIFFYFTVTIIVALITFFICSLLPSKGLLFLLVKGVVCCVIPNILFWLVYHKRPEFQMIIELINKIMKKIKGLNSHKS
jgi:O-antigen/teichoic acid export membrane protein